MKYNREGELRPREYEGIQMLDHATPAFDDEDAAVAGVARDTSVRRRKAYFLFSKSLTTAVMLRSPRFSFMAFWNTSRTALTVGTDAASPAVFTV
jgi:hypothetical protein